MTTMTAQLSFALNNGVAGATIYVSTDPSENSLTLVMSSNVSASFAPGTLVPIEQAAQGSGSLLYLDLTQLCLTEAEFSVLTLDHPDWNFSLYYSSSAQLIGFTPSTSSVSVSSTSTPISLRLENFTLATAPSTPTVQLSVTYFRVNGITYGNSPFNGNFGVAIAYPPDQNNQDLQLAVLASLSPDAVVNCSSDGESLSNDLVLVFSPGSKPSVINSTADTRFTLSFIYASDANGFGAMMTPAQAQPPAFTVTAGQNASSWTITPNTSAQNPYWTLIPPVGQPLVGTGTQSTVSFNIAGLITNFQPGPTVVLVAYQNVPGYMDGTYSILVEKYPHVQVENFTVTPAQSALVNGQSPISVTWTAYDATQLTLYLTEPSSPSESLARTASATSATSVTASSAAIIDVTGKTSYSTQISDSKEFVLIAEGQSPDNSVNNQVIASATAYITPVINSFSVTPQYIQQNEPNTCTISWSVNAPSGTEIMLSSSLNGPDGINYALTGSRNETLSQPQQFTLTATPECGYPVVSSTYDVYMIPVITAFSVSPASITLASPNTYTASWNVTADSSINVALSGTVNGQISNGLALTGSQGIQLLRPQTLMLTASVPGGSPSVQSSLAMPAPGLLATNYTPSIKDSSNQTPGQQVTTPAGGPWTNIIFNFFNTANSSPYALGTLYLLTQPYTGTPSSLSKSAPGFVASANPSNNQWVFDSKVKLEGGTSYYFFMSSHPPQGTAATYPNSQSGFQGYGSANGTDGFLTRPFQIQFALYGS
jgi:hypothetical protein